METYPNYKLLLSAEKVKQMQPYRHELKYIPE